MKRTLIGFLALAVLCGCQSDPPAGTGPSTANTPATPAGGGGGVAPIGSNVGGITPVAGAESVGGSGGGGVGAAAKEMAKSRASAAGGIAGANEAAGMFSGEGGE
ncbi:MAG TPA: hypothetical protein VJ835_02350 [Fimbriimonadaceae bacterium]|nr:hypothetical protein [Fimbriimonadaceae bacterium]